MSKYMNQPSLPDLEVKLTQAWYCPIKAPINVALHNQDRPDKGMDTCLLVYVRNGQLFHNSLRDGH